ncbi:capsid protein [Cyclovirus TN18]|uniref:Capsid protein n=1 Tax=Cyclovirus TN18 TaxID=742925 RepID=D4N3R5_9CIRC|nr:capsid protein [Cyclovirus TN18]
MAFRRRVGRSRAPIRRKLPRRRVARRRRFRRSRRLRGNFTVLAKRTQVVVIQGDEGGTVTIAPSLNDFTELAPLVPNFEGFRIWSVSCKIRPLFNVASDVGPVPRYYVAPWHKPTPTTVDSNGVLSIDRSKSYNGTSGAFRRFVPALLSAVGYSGIAGNQYGKIEWRPRVELNSNTQSLQHYCGVVHWSKDQLPGAGAPSRRQYEIELIAKITLYNQKYFIG